MPDEETGSGAIARDGQDPSGEPAPVDASESPSGAAPQGALASPPPAWVVFSQGVSDPVDPVDPVEPGAMLHSPEEHEIALPGGVPSQDTEPLGAQLPPAAPRGALGRQGGPWAPPAVAAGSAQHYQAPLGGHPYPFRAAAPVARSDSSALPPPGFPPGSLPPGGFAPGSVPPGSLPPGGFAPGSVPPGAFLPSSATPGRTVVAASKDNRPRSTRGWVAVAVVAAIIGAGVGAGVTAATDHSNGTGLTVIEGSSAPGPAMLSGNVSIPKLVQKVLPAVVSIDVTDSEEEDEGTGMILSSSGEVVTNNHVIALAAAGGKITVTRSGTTTKHAATLIGTDPADDVALLQVKGVSGLPTITFGNSNKADVGDAVVAIGNALGLQAGTPTVTQGIISALGRTVTASEEGSSLTETLNNMIQTDAAINPGNSGGPLIDTAGQVIAMNTAVAGSTGDGTDAQNIGFAIPSAKIESLLPMLLKGGSVQTGGGVLGVTVTTLTTQLRQEYGFTPKSGAVVLSVLPGSPADSAGLAEGDVIVAVDSTQIATAESLQTAIGKHKAGTKVQITYYLGALKRTTSATLESAGDEQQQEAGGSSPSNPTTPGGGTTGRGTSTSLTPYGSLAP